MTITEGNSTATYHADSCRAAGIVRVSRTNGREREGLALVEIFEELDVSGGSALARRPGLGAAVRAVEAGDVGTTHPAPSPASSSPWLGRPARTRSTSALQSPNYSMARPTTFHRNDTSFIADILEFLSITPASPRPRARGIA